MSLQKASPGSILRFHVRVDGRRTTVSLNAHLCELLSWHFHESPDSPDAHGRVALYLQDIVDRSKARPDQLSSFLTEYVLDVIAKTNLVERHAQWVKENQS